MKKHSSLGASGMHRWSQCPGSVRLAATVENRSSRYAEEGTEAHAFAERWLRTKACPNDWPDEEMRDAVAVYVKTVEDDYRQSAEGSDLLVEQRFDLGSVYPGCFGTADACTYDRGSKTLRVYDYKHGAGVAVEVSGNPQLLYYGLGALLSTGYACDEVELVIVQPRCPHPDGPVRRHRLKAIELIDFAADLAEYAKATEDPNAPLNPGDHCRFCPASGVCPAVHGIAQRLAKQQFTPALSYDPAALSETLRWLPILEAWIKQTREFAYGEAQHGRTPPGWKVVDKQAVRKWRDEAAAKAALIKFGVAETDLYEPQEFLSAPKIEKVIGKKAFAKLLEDHEKENLVVKESSGSTLAPDTDKRPEVRRDPKSEFSPVKTEEPTK